MATDFRNASNADLMAAVREIAFRMRGIMDAHDLRGDLPDEAWYKDKIDPRHMMAIAGQIREAGEYMARWGIN